MSCAVSEASQNECMVIRRGAGERKPLEWNQEVIRFKDCPDCKGRGWFLINPFGQLGPANTCQCLTCLDSHDYFKQHGVVPILKEAE